MRSELRRLRGRGRHAWAVAMALLLAATAAHALDPRVAVSQYERRGWGVDEGLPNSTVTGIAQTPDGYIWVSTFEGLARFDGVRFSTCTDEPVLNAWLFSLLVDRRGTLWVGTSGKGLIANRNGVFKVEERVRALGVEDVFALALGSDESLWMGTNIGVVRRFPSGELQSWSEKDGLPAPQVRALMFARNGDLWIGTEQGVARLSGGKITHAGTAAALPSRPVRAMHEDSAGRIWVGTTEGLFCLQNGRRIRVPAVSDIETSHVASILEDEHHTLWFGSSAGLKRVAADGTTTPLVDRGLQGVFVVSLFADRERNLWLGSFSGGLDRLRDTPFRPYGSSQGLGSDTVFAVTQDRSGAMWFGTNNGAGRLRNGHVDWFTRAQGLPNDSVITVTPSRLGGVWLGMYGGGVCHVDGAVAPQCFGYAEGLSHGVVLNVLEDPDGDLWIATLGGGLNRLHHGKITAYGVQQGLPSTRITALALARDGGIWAGMISGGVVHFQDGRVVSTVPLLDGHTDVRAIIEEPDGTLWIGLDGEGTIAFVKQGRVTLCRLKAFLPVTSINNLLDDGAGSLWIITTRCIARVGKRELLDYAAGKVSSIQPVIFGRMQGVTSARFPTGQPSAWRASDGSLWFNGTRGATRLDRDALARQAVFVPGAVVESATADGLLLSGNEPVVTDREARLTFRYTALAFAVPDELTFRYKLDGYDRQWVDAGSSRSAVYTNLPPRRYTFRVMAVNRGRPWSEAGTAAFRFERLPVFTETNTFYAACALLLLAAGGAVVRMRVHNLKKRERRLTERVAEQTAALLHANTQLTTAKEAAETTAGLNAELSLRKQTILNAAGEGIFGLDADGRTTFVNSFAARLLGWSIEDLVGRSLHALIHPAGSPAALATVNDCLLCSAVLEPSMRSHTEVFVLRAGKSIPVEYTTSAITMDDGKRNGVVITFRDIRERQQIERMKSEFVSTVSHELRTPLTSIRGALGLLRGGLLGTVPPKFQRMIDIAASNTDRLARLINDILDLERLDSGTIQYERRSLDTYDLMVQVSEMIQTVADQAGVALAVEPVHALINADADRITQILTNLIGNAVKFSGRGTVVMLTGSRDDESFTFHVSDHGRGIPAEKLDLIFERFQQVNSSDARDKGGTGLGLAICRSIARAHGGHVWAESVEDVGSVFRLRLPLLQEASPTESLAS